MHHENQNPRPDVNSPTPKQIGEIASVDALIDSILQPATKALSPIDRPIKLPPMAPPHLSTAEEFAHDQDLAQRLSGRNVSHRD
jgi:hypothetical protein